MYQAVLRLSDSEGRTSDYAANFAVAGRLAVEHAPAQGREGRQALSVACRRDGWRAPEGVDDHGGKLPKGIRFDRKLGLLSGTPTKTGRYRLTFQVSDGLKVVAKKTLRIDVLP